MKVILFSESDIKVLESDVRASVLSGLFQAIIFTRGLLTCCGHLVFVHGAVCVIVRVGVIYVCRGYIVHVGVIGV